MSGPPTIFVLLCLASLTEYNVLQVHPYCYVRCPSSLRLNPILLHIYICILHFNDPSSAVGVIDLLGSSIGTLLGSLTETKAPLCQGMWIVGRLCV